MCKYAYKPVPILCKAFLIYFSVDAFYMHNLLYFDDILKTGWFLQQLNYSTLIDPSTEQAFIDLITEQAFFYLYTELAIY